MQRRDFLKATGAMAAAAAIHSRAYAGGDDVLRIGWVGCGARGSGAVLNALQADKNVKLVAAGDAFKDKLDYSLKLLEDSAKVGDKVAVVPEKRFVGFDAYKQVIDSGVDVVLLTAPPHFRPLHLQYAVEKGKHIFAEKPVAVDAPGIRAVLEICEEARKKKLSLVSGLCWRYDAGTGELAGHLQNGGIGEIKAIQTCYNGGETWSKDRQENWSDMEYQLRNWLYYTWLSGDMIVEQNVHNLDRAAWYLKGEYPVKATSLGGRQVRTDPKFGNIFDHFATVYEYASGAKVFNYCRQQAGTTAENGDYLFGTKGNATWLWNNSTVIGEKPAAFKHNLGQAYQKEHNVLFESIRKGEPLNNGEYMAKSTLMGIMGRMSAYTGQALTWEQVLNSKEDLSPKAYEWSKLDFPKVAKPGLTTFS